MADQSQIARFAKADAIFADDLTVGGAGGSALVVVQRVSGRRVKQHEYIVAPREVEHQRPELSRRLAPRGVRPRSSEVNPRRIGQMWQRGWVCEKLTDVDDLGVPSSWLLAFGEEPNAKSQVRLRQ